MKNIYIYILIWIYRNISNYIIKPFLPAYMKFRILKGKEDPIRYLEKLVKDHKNISKNTYHNSNNSLIWIHVASVGEFNSIISLLEKIINYQFNINKCVNFLITSTTLSSSKVIESYIQKHNSSEYQIFHRFFPFDIPEYIELFIKLWNPDLTIFVESELWPNTIIALNSHKIPIILVNAKMSNQAFKKWLYIRPLGSFLFSKFSLIMPSTKLDFERYSKFDIDINKIKYIGNLKYDVAIPSFNINIANEFIQYIKNNEINAWVCGSTHHGEEEIIIQTHVELRKQFIKLITIIIPRHPIRASEIAKLAINSNLNYALFSQNFSTDNLLDIDIYIIDVLGYSYLFYNISPIVFIGGSLVNIGGHNLFEPAIMNCAVITGKYTHKCSEMVSNLLLNEGIIVVEDQKNLIQQLIHLFKNPEKVIQLQKAAFKAASNHKNITIKTIELILDYL